MLVVSGVSFDVSTIIKEYPESSIERLLLNTMAASGEKYQYNNLNQLKFELNLRKEIVGSAIALNNSSLSFAVFKDSKCNPKYWRRTENGGFLLLENAKPSEAINDIFSNGAAYATECATAMVIIYYKALLNIYGEELFNQTFSKIYLMDWDIREPLLTEVRSPQKVAELLLGDRGYFNNPEYNPATPEWEGENVIVLPNSLYYGHGIGLTTADNIIKALNSQRMATATVSAYLLNAAGRPNFTKLSGVINKSSPRTAPLVWRPFPAPISL